MKTRIAMLLAVLSMAGIASAAVTLFPSEKISSDNTVKGFVILLKSDNPQFRMMAAKELGQMRATTHNAPDALKATLEDQDPKVVAAAATALVDIGTKESIKNLHKGYLDLQKKNSPAANEIKPIYDRAIMDLQTKATAGDKTAKGILDGIR